jgi:hypothetical protein
MAGFPGGVPSASTAGLPSGFAGVGGPTAGLGGAAGGARPPVGAGPHTSVSQAVPNSQQAFAGLGLAMGLGPGGMGTPMMGSSMGAQQAQQQLQPSGQAGGGKPKAPAAAADPFGDLL